MNANEQLEPRRVRAGYRRYLKKLTARLRRREGKRLLDDASKGSVYREYAT